MVPNFAKRLRRMARNGLLRAIGITFALIVAGQTQASPFVVLQSLQQQLSQEEIAWIAANPVIRVHNEMDWPPYNFNVDGEPSGFSIDYMRLLAEQAGLEVEFISGPTWNEFLDMMRAGDLDVMLNIVDTPARREFLLYTDPYAITLRRPCSQSRNK